MKNVRCDKNVLKVDLSDGRIVIVPLVWFPKILRATTEQRGNWQICGGGGFGIHWPDIDEDLSTEGLLRGAPAPGQRHRETREVPRCLMHNQ